MDAERPDPPPSLSGHHLLGWKAVRSLPTWEQALIRPDLSPGALAKPYLPRGIRTGADKLAALCLILDWIYYDECRPYATLPDGRWIPHTLPDANFQAASSGGLPYSPAAHRHLTATLMQRMVQAIRAGDWEEAIRWGGALGHFLQEPFTPGHAMSNRIFEELFPDPDAGRHLRLHFAFDSASPLFDPLPPRLMGRTVAEAAFRLQLEVDRGVREGKKLVPAVIQSVYAGQPGLVRQALLTGQSQQASFVTASAWHTAIAIALDRFDPAEAAALGPIDLAGVVPYFLHASDYTDVLPGCLVQNERKIPIHVWAGGGAGPAGEVLVENGFGMYGHMGIKFAVDGDAFPRFRCRVGLPSRQRKGQTAHTDTRFFVETDPAENRVYSEDMEYKARRIAELRLEAGAPPAPVDVSIRGAQSLILTAQSRSYTDPASGDVRWDVPHVAVCEPQLLPA